MGRIFRRTDPEVAIAEATRRIQKAATVADISARLSRESRQRLARVMFERLDLNGDQVTRLKLAPAFDGWLGSRGAPPAQDCDGYAPADALVPFFLPASLAA